MDAADDLGNTPALLAAVRDETAALRLLIEAGCDVNKVRKDGENMRLMAGWRSYVIEERRSLATLMALWKRQRRSAATGPSSGETRAPSPLGAPGDVAVLLGVFELPLDLAGRVLCFYTDLVLSA